MLKRLMCGGLVLGAVLAGDAFGAPDTAVADRLRQQLTATIPGLVVESVAESPIEGLYEVRTNGRETLFVSGDGTHLVVGELYEVRDGGVVNLSEERRAEARAERLEAVPDEQLISFKPEGETKAIVNVFTDIDCPYCRKLHQEVPELNAMGIQVNYLAFPRSGPNTPSFAKAVSTWCADNPRAAMNRAKSGQSIESRTCENPVAEHFRLGNEIGVTGTPAIVLEDGRIIRGYLPKDRLAAVLGIQ